MENPKSRKNHYVPQWYQRGFLAPGQSQYLYLDLSPNVKVLPDGRAVPMYNPIQTWGSNKCFVQHDLYTVTFGQDINDEIERLLFGQIDANGFKAVQALINEDGSEIHNTFTDFYRYLGAQIIRTPKGLDWIQAQYPRLAQHELMREMQELRVRYCTMWTEGVREIVSAKESELKFIVTDNPVTIFNPEFEPDSDKCIYPHEPSIGYVGSQTIFPLDANHCLILTHLEYAEGSIKKRLTEDRTNARYHGTSMVRTDAYIRERKLSREEVSAINYALKFRAKRYIAASEKDGLYPEKEFKGGWGDIAKILKPSSDGLWQFGGEIFAHYESGETYYQDQFGRTSGAHKYLKKDLTNNKIGDNDSCGCGSGRKFKKCCRNIDEKDRPSWNVYGIRERNLIFIDKIENILGLDKERTWNDVRRDISDDHVVQIYEILKALWPSDTDLYSLLPRPCPNTLRAVFLGTPDFRTAPLNITEWLKYFDEVVVAHPFINPGLIRPEFNPINIPQEHKEQILKNLCLMFELMPYIEMGIVHLVPDPGDFNIEFAQNVLQISKKRSKSHIDARDVERQKGLWENDNQRILYRLSDDALERYIKQVNPELSKQQIQLVIADTRKMQQEDPCALLQPLVGNTRQFMYLKGYTPEVAIFLAALTGSVLYTDTYTHWKQLQGPTIPVVSTQYRATSEEIFEKIDFGFPIHLDVIAAFEARTKGAFGEVRSAMRSINEVSRANSDKTRTMALLGWLNQIRGYFEKTKSLENCDLEAKIEILVPEYSFENNDVRRMLLTFASTSRAAAVTMAILIKFDNSEKS